LPSEDIKGAYDAWAATYDTDEPRHLRDLAAAVLRRQPFDLSGRCVVELGCGTGANTGWFAESADRIIALDFSGRMLEQARRRVASKRVRFVEHDITIPWPVHDEFADLVVASLVLEHVRDLGPVFEHARKILKSGGALFVCELHPFLQLSGAKAQYLDPATRTITQVPAFRHDVSDFVNGGIAAGLRLTRLDEWRYPWDAIDAPPKLLTVDFAK
jgi:ubiquinone/menaquinone biosynthesis C-methylase UbiE